MQKAVFELDYEQYKLVREALHERKTFLHTAPYLSHSLPIMLPIYTWWQIPYFFACVSRLRLSHSFSPRDPLKLIDFYPASCPTVDVKCTTSSQESKTWNRRTFSALAKPWKRFPCSKRTVSAVPSCTMTVRLTSVDSDFSLAGI